MADRYWVGGSGTWNTTSTTNWSASSGGASGASVPTAADSVFFDQAGTYTVTTTGALTCLDFTVSAGTVTFATGTSPTFAISGSMSLVAGTVWSTSGAITFNATTTGKVITTNGVSLVGNIIFNGVGGGWTLGSALTATLGSLTVTNGTFDTSPSGNYSVTVTALSSSGASTRAINLNASTINVSANPVVFSSSLTFNAGTSQINSSSSSGTFSGAGLTFYNVSFTGTTAATKTISGANTFNNLSFIAPSTAGVSTVTFAANQTINGTLSTTSTAGNQRVFFASDTYGIGRTLTVNSAPSLTDADFRDLYIIGTAAPISGTRIGNRGNCTGITFSTPKTVYWNLALGGNWESNAWATSSGGSVSTSNFPLPQDTAIIENTGLNTGAAIASGVFPYISSVDMSLRTNSMLFSFSGATTVYGNITAGSGTSFSGSSTLTFSGGTTQTITSAGKTFPGALAVDTYGGTVQLADALNIGTQTLLVTNGTFNTQGFAVTAGSLASTGSNVRTISLGASTVTLSTNGTNISCATTTNLTLNAGTSQINCSGQSTNIQLANSAGSPVTLYNVATTSTNNASITIEGPITFNNLTITPRSSGILPVSFSANQTINGTLTCAGASAVRRVFLRSDTVGTQRTLTAAAISANDCDFRDIVLAGTAAGSSPTRAGDCGNNSGITFPAPKTVYWSLAGINNWGDTAWATSSGGTPAVNNFPLAQDTAIFDNAVVITRIDGDSGWNVGTINFSARTNAMTYNPNQTLSVYGDLTFGTGLSFINNGGGFNFLRNGGTQTITSNGCTFPANIRAQNPNGYVQLGDALNLGAGSNGNLTVTAGTFDAVTYNVTIWTFSASATSTTRMGSGTWTLTAAGGSPWNGAGTNIAGTSTIVLSDTSTATRQFFGNNLYYNKLTIGGATGTSTLFIFGTNIFGELASTKTVAHTIDFSGTSQTFGKWSVTGTAGNVVTLSQPGTANVIAGPAVTGVDYLAMGTWGVSTTSPGEFYAGANSTGTAAAPVYRTAAPSPRTLYWVGGTGNWSTTAKWSTSSGGASGAAIPTSLDAVIFDSASNATAYTATIDAGVTIARCAAFTMAGPASGNVTFAGTVPIAFHGNVTFAATGITRSYTGAMNWAGNSSYTFTTNGLALNSTTTVNGIGSTWTLGSALDVTTANLVITYGTFSTSASNYSITGGTFTSNNSNVRSILFNASSVTLSQGGLSFANSTNLSFSSGTSTFTTSHPAPSFSGGGQTFYNVSFTSAAASTITITGTNTFNNLTFTGLTSLGINAVTFSANQTINGTLTLGAGTAAAYRTFLASDTIGTQRTLTVNALAAGAADIDFRDITVTGAATPLTGTRFGDCKGNSGITFPAAKTVYFRATSSSTDWGFPLSGSWSATSGGAADATMFPLAQDTAVFPASTYPPSGGSVSISANYNIGTIDMSLRTSNTMTLATSTSSPAIYGNWINGTGTTLSGSNQLVFCGRGNTQTITSAGVTFTFPIAQSNIGGTVILSDTLSISASGAALVLNYGTFNANNNNVSLTNAASTFSSSNSNIRTLAIGSGTWTIAGTLPWSCTTTTNLTVTGTGTISVTSASGKTFIGGGANYSGITLNQGGAGTLTITGNNTFKNITNSYSATGAATINFGATTTTLTDPFTATGAAAKVLSLTGTSAASPATLIFSGGGRADTTSDYLSISNIRAYPTTSSWYAGDNSTNLGSLGWIFTAFGGVVYAVYIAESAVASDSIAAAFSAITYDSSIAESSTATDSVISLANFYASASEQATATDTAAATAIFGSSITEQATATDTVAASQNFGSSITEQANATDTTAAAQAFGSAITETATASDTTAASQNFGSSMSEQATSADTVAAVQGFGASVTEQANATDTTSAIQNFGSSITEQAQGSDTISATRQFGASMSEQANASDTAAAAQGFNSQIAETATAADQSAVAASVFNPAVSETLTANDTTASNYSVNSAVSETANASDAINAKAIFLASLVEFVSAVDTVAAAQTFAVSIAELGSALDVVDAARLFASVISETATAQDLIDGNAAFNSAVSELASCTDAAAAQMVFATVIEEMAAALDSVDAPGSTYNASVQETSNAADSVTTSAIFYAMVIIQAGITDAATAGYLWNLIDDSQASQWALINDIQTINFCPVNIDFWRSSASSDNVRIILGLNASLKQYIAVNTYPDTTWEMIPINTNATLYNVVFSEDRFFVYGTNGFIASSTDGLVWNTLTTTPLAGTIYSVAYNGTTLVAIENNTPCISNDGGLTWTSSGATLLGNAKEVIWGYLQNVFVFAGRNGIFTSPDGLTWTQRLTLSGGFDRRGSIATNSAVYVACFSDVVASPINFTYTSNNTTTWTNRSSTYGRSFLSVTYNYGIDKFVYTTFSGTALRLYTNAIVSVAPTLAVTATAYGNSIASPSLFKPSNAFDFGSEMVVPGIQTDNTKYFFYLTDLSALTTPEFLPLWVSVDDSAPTTWQNINTLN